MTTKYSVKRCNTFGFAQTLKYAKSLFEDSKLSSSNVIYLHDSDDVDRDSETRTINHLSKNSSSFSEVNSIESLTPPESKSAIIFVKLANTKNTTINVPIHYNDQYIIEGFEHKFASPEFTDAVVNICDRIDSMKENKLSTEFLTYLIDLYPHLRDYDIKNCILDLLAFNDYNTVELVNNNPFEFELQDVTQVISANMFSDIEISVDKHDKNTSTSLYKADRNALRNAALGKATQLDAFSENKFAIIHTKKSAGIETKIRNQNHDVLDTLAVNGVIKSPDTKKPLSIYKLVKKLEAFDSFDIVFIHPSYEIKCMNSEYPCEQIIPSYKINEGELLAVVYRYMVIYFFGYCSIFTDSMLEWRYYI